MKRLFLIVALLLATVPVRAQEARIDTGSITAVSSGGACSAAPAGCAVFMFQPGVLPSVTLQVSGTFSATLLFEATSDGTNWQTITGIKLLDGSSATGATATGQFAFQNTGLTGLRVRCTAYTSGTAVVTAVRGYAAARWLTPFFTSLTSAGDVTAGATGAFAWTGLSRITSPSDGVILLTNAAGTDFTRLQFGGTTSSFPSLQRSGTTLQVKGADGVAFAPFSAISYALGTPILITGTAPTVTSAGTSPSVTSSNGTATFRVNVGTGGTATTIVLAMPTASTGWNCNGSNITAAAANRNPTGILFQQSSTTTAATLQYQTVGTGAALAFVASDIVQISCMAF